MSVVLTNIASLSLMARGDIRPARFIKISASQDHACEEADANERIIGIAEEGSRQAPIPSVTTVLEAASGDVCRAYGQGDTCLLELGGTVARNGGIKSDGDGKGVAVAITGTTIQNWGAIALESGVSGEKIKVKVHIAVVLPAVA